MTSLYFTLRANEVQSNSSKKNCSAASVGREASKFSKASLGLQIWENLKMIGHACKTTEESHVDFGGVTSCVSARKKTTKTQTNV